MDSLSPSTEFFVKTTKVRKIGSAFMTPYSHPTEFVDMLNSMRRGIVTPEIAERMNELSRDIVYPDGIEPTDL